MATIKKTIKKAQGGYKSPFGKKTPDSSQYFAQKRADNARAASNLRQAGLPESSYRGYIDEARGADDDMRRQFRKGRPGFDENGRPVPKESKAAVAGKSAASAAGKYTKTTIKLPSKSPVKSGLKESLQERIQKTKTRPNYESRTGSSISKKRMGGKIKSSTTIKKRK